MTQPQQPQQRNLFDFFDDDAKRVVQAARDEVVRTKRDAIGPEHLALATLKLDGGKARELVEEAGVEIEALCGAIDEVAGFGQVEEAPQQLPFTPRGQQTMQILVQIMGSVFHRTVGTEHLLLALIQDPEGVLSKAIERAGAERQKVGDTLMQFIKSLPVDEEIKAQAEAARKQQAAAQQQAQAAGAQGGRPMPVGGGNLSPSAQRVLQAAGQQAAELRHTQIGTVHLLLALVSDPDRMANNVFVRLGIRPEDVRTELMAQLRAEEPKEAGAEAPTA